MSACLFFWRFWFIKASGNEPDNSGGDESSPGEDCACLGYENVHLNSWFDAPCKYKKKFICEMEYAVWWLKETYCKKRIQLKNFTSLYQLKLADRLLFFTTNHFLQRSALIISVVSQLSVKLKLLDCVFYTCSAFDRAFLSIPFFTS